MNDGSGQVASRLQEDSGRDEACISQGPGEARERSNQHRIRQIGINKEVVNLDGERMRGQRWAQRRKRFNFYFNGLSLVAELTKSIASNWILTCLTV